MTRLLVRRVAESDVEIAARWYEGERPGLSQRFLKELGHNLARIQEAPAQFTLVSQVVRRALLRRFPYAVYFVVEEEALVVLAILHLRRHPNTWKERSGGAC